MSFAARKVQTMEHTDACIQGFPPNGTHICLHFHTSGIAQEIEASLRRAALHATLGDFPMAQKAPSANRATRRGDTVEWHRHADIIFYGAKASQTSDTSSPPVRDCAVQVTLRRTSPMVSCSAPVRLVSIPTDVTRTVAML